MSKRNQQDELLINRISKGFAVVSSETGLIYRTLSTFQEAEQWRDEASTSTRTSRK